jgi:hypothetical protein
MSQLIAALATFPARFQQAIHGANRAMKLALIEQRCIDLGRRRVLKTILMKAPQHDLLFGFRQSTRREPRPGRRPGKRRRLRRRYQVARGTANAWQAGFTPTSGLS